MAIKDKIVKWFIENIVIPQQEIIDKPGFIVEAYNKANREVFLREIVVPEEIIARLENQIVLKFGARGKEVLYSAGKMFGHSYAGRSLFPQITSSSQKEFESFVYMWIRYIEAIAYGRINYIFDKNSGTINLQLSDFIICSKNGMGYFITLGSFAGFWAYLMDDYSVECIQKKCQGRGDEACELIAGRKKFLEKKGAENIASKVLVVLPNDGADKNMNAIRPCRFNNKSFKDLLDNKFFKYDGGEITRMDKRYFIIESSAMYFLESELMKIDKSNKILFGLSFEFGKSLAKKNEKDYEKIISTYLSAMGYGDIYIFSKREKIHVSSDYFPWAPYADKVNFALFRGVLSGLLSGFVGRNIFLKNVSSDTQQGFLRIEMSE